MDKANKVFLSIALILLIAAALVYVISPKTTGLTINEYSEEENIKLATFAVCEQKENYTLCKDKLFASCDNIPIEIKEPIFYCNGEEFNISSLPLGETYQIQNWSDPRQEDFITAWAASG